MEYLYVFASLLVLSKKSWSVPEKILFLRRRNKVFVCVCVCVRLFGDSDINIITEFKIISEEQKQIEDDNDEEEIMT